MSFRARRALTVLSFAGIASAALTGAASAQGVCDGGQKIFQSRAAIIGQINKWGKNKIDPGVACSTFGKLEANGTEALTFMRTNKDWCHIPDNAVTAIEQQQTAVQKNKAQACKVAADFAKAKKQAQAQAAKQAQGGGNSAFAGPDDVSGGARAVPGGAL